MTFLLYELKNRICKICSTEYKPTNPSQKYCKGCFKESKRIRHRKARKASDQRTHLYDIWYGMLRRCYNEECTNYPRYGAKGIYVDESWHDFDNFYKDMFPKPNGDFQLDRKDVTGPYSKDNCRWVSRRINNWNKNGHRLITYNGYTKPVSWWSKYKGIHVNTLSNRLDRGWSVEKALETPVQKRSKPVV